jgi:hypothetical protein
MPDIAGAYNSYEFSSVDKTTHLREHYTRTFFAILIQNLHILFILIFYDVPSITTSDLATFVSFLGNNDTHMYRQS